jgi:hypothetical protein
MTSGELMIMEAVTVHTGTQGTVCNDDIGAEERTRRLTVSSRFSRFRCRYHLSCTWPKVHSLSMFWILFPTYVCTRLCGVFEENPPAPIISRLAVEMSLWWKWNPIVVQLTWYIFFQLSFYDTYGSQVSQEFVEKILKLFYFGIVNYFL